MPRSAIALACLLLAAAAGVLFIPYLTEEREILVSTPATEPLFTTPALIELDGGERACASGVLLDPEAGIARFRVGTFGSPGQPLELDLAAAGYRERVPVPRGYPDNAVISVQVDGPAHERLGRACIENEGRMEIALYATTEPRTKSRIDVAVDGEPVAADLALSFLEPERHSIIERAPEILVDMTAFRPIGPWFAWPLAFLVLLGVPGLALWSMHRAFREPPDDQPNAATSRSASPTTRG